MTQIATVELCGFFGSVFLVREDDVIRIFNLEKKGTWYTRRSLIRKYSLALKNRCGSRE